MFGYCPREKQYGGFSNFDFDSTHTSSLFCNCHTCYQKGFERWAFKKKHKINSETLRTALVWGLMGVLVAYLIYEFSDTIKYINSTRTYKM